jgi:hypothetical protein
MLSRVLREPLLHFACLGAALFLLHRILSPAPPRRIDVTTEAVWGLARDHERRTGAPPSDEVLRGLLSRYLDDEVLYREALALGLDRGDVIVRRRLIQKMEFLAEQTEAQDEDQEPTDAELQAHLDRQPDRYTLPARASLVHVFVSRDRHGARLAEQAEALRARLLRGEDPAGLGDPFPRGQVLREQREADLAGALGPDLARAALALPEGAWSPPLPSSYGLHLCRVTARTPARAPRLAEVRAEVRRDLLHERRERARRAALDRLRRGYEIHLPADRRLP